MWSTCKAITDMASGSLSLFIVSFHIFLPLAFSSAFSPGLTQPPTLSRPVRGLPTNSCLRSAFLLSELRVVTPPGFVSSHPEPVAPLLVLPLFGSLASLSCLAMTLVSLTPWVFHKYCKCQVREDPHIVTATSSPGRFALLLLLQNMEGECQG